MASRCCLFNSVTPPGDLSKVFQSGDFCGYHWKEVRKYCSSGDVDTVVMLWYSVHVATVQGTEDLQTEMRWISHPALEQCKFTRVLRASLSCASKTGARGSLPRHIF